ncbi:MAG: hypothetical protein FWE91_00370 [Defluviitaleaceae bacterium]|nr:hypothetical protein [Defluviitaleaceae bacterium]MCL2836265.1 hypothetical protein [Defluviitaleaceae bacterium]
MYKIGVAGDNGAIAKELRQFLPRVPDASIDTADAGEWDVLVLNGGVGHETGSLSAPAVVLNSDEKNLAGLLDPSSIPLLTITYGFNSKASITASSVRDGELCVCVQRSFTTPSGKRRERQEFTVETRNPAATLAAVSAALTMDADFT